MSIIYVAGPYSKGDVAVNVRNAIDYGMKLNDQGHYAVIPHCHEVHQLPGKSSGADKEMELARSLGIKTTVIYGV